MSDPYRILGVSKKDSDSVIKEAYRNLIKKYHPDNYSESSPVNGMAEEKMAEINNAFDEIMNMRRGASSADNYNNSASGNSSFIDYSEIRNLIQNKDITLADGKLESVDPSLRNAEWYFLKGSVCYTRGWLNEALENFTTASNMDPNNQEYAAAFNHFQRNRQGNMNGSPYPQYRTNRGASGCSGCELCQGLICADCCCECMGGDLISCC